MCYSVRYDFFYRHFTDLNTAEEEESVCPVVTFVLAVCTLHESFVSYGNIKFASGVSCVVWCHMGGEPDPAQYSRTHMSGPTPEVDPDANLLFYYLTNK